MLVGMFVAAYALPPLRPTAHRHRLLQPILAEHRRHHRHLMIRQDLLGDVARHAGRATGSAVAVISTLIAATVGSVAGYFGGGRDKAMMWIVDLLLVVPVSPASPSSRRAPRTRPTSRC